MFRKVSGIKKLCLTEVSRFFVKIFFEILIRNQRKITFLIGLERKSSKVKIVINLWCSEPYWTPQNLVVLLTVSWEPLELPTNINEFTKQYGTIKIRAWTYCFKQNLS